MLKRTLATLVILAVVVIGGLFTSTLLTLYVLPVIYRRFILERAK